ncbi:MAG: hypothetical protein NZM12_10745 [Steroidobacteraceae bacterium]|nr:hypothetical protein [Steroidobacteraceae bacterium]MDW8258676.1 hypothetical protein [Gammaproteobacteria bacterium]
MESTAGRAAALVPFQRPYRIGEVLDVGCRLFQRTALANVPVALAAVLLGQAPAAYSLSRTEHVGSTLGGGLLRDPGWWAVYGASTLLILALWAILLLRQSAAARGGRIALGAALRETARCFPRIVVIVLLTGALLAGTAALIVAPVLQFAGPRSPLLLLAVLPAGYVALRLWFALPALLFSGVGPIAAIGVSVRLVRGNVLRTAMILSVAALVVMVIYALGGVIGLIVAPLVAADGATGGFVALVLAEVVGALFMPFLTALTIAQYEDLSVRRQGADLQRRIDALPNIAR